MGKAGIGAPEFFRNHGIADAEAFDVDLVDDGIGQRRLGLAIVAPIEIALDDDAFRHAGGAVLDVHLEIVAGSEIVGEDGLLPTDMAGDGPGIGIDEQLVVVEAVSVLRVPGAVDAIAIKLSGFDAANEAMPYKRGALAEGDALALSAIGIEEADIDARGAFREDCEIRTLVVRGWHPGGKAGPVKAFGSYRLRCRSCGSLLYSSYSHLLPEMPRNCNVMRPGPAPAGERSRR